MRFDFVTIFPSMFEPLLAEGIIARGVKQGLLEARVWDLRDFASDKHRSTDDEAYGGGPGMVMLAEPLQSAIGAARDAQRAAGAMAGRVIYLSPQGATLRHERVMELAREPGLILLAGRYEGIDERLLAREVDEEISLGDYVLSGGELPAMVLADAVGRMVEGVVGNSGSVEEDSFFRGLLDYPHYTRPEDVRGLRVPDVLLSGHHEKIRRWRREQALRATLAKRPDLLHNAELDDEARQILERIRNE